MNSSTERPVSKAHLRATRRQGYKAYRKEYVKQQVKKNLQKLREERQKLISRLGGRCTICGETKHLEVNHINGRNYDWRSLDRRARIRRLLKEEATGVPLNILCRHCNARYKPPKTESQTEQPF